MNRSFENYWLTEGRKKGGDERKKGVASERSVKVLALGLASLLKEKAPMRYHRMIIAENAARSH